MSHFDENSSENFKGRLKYKSNSNCEGTEIKFEENQVQFIPVQLHNGDQRHKRTRTRTYCSRRLLSQQFNTEPSEAKSSNNCNAHRKTNILDQDENETLKSSYSKAAIYIRKNSLNRAAMIPFGSRIVRSVYCSTQKNFEEGGYFVDTSEESNEDLQYEENYSSQAIYITTTYVYNMKQAVNVCEQSNKEDSVRIKKEIHFRQNKSIGTKPIRRFRECGDNSITSIRKRRQKSGNTTKKRDNKDGSIYPFNFLEKISNYDLQFDGPFLDYSIRKKTRKNDNFKESNRFEHLKMADICPREVGTCCCDSRQNPLCENSSIFSRINHNHYYSQQFLNRSSSENYETAIEDGEIHCVKTEQYCETTKNCLKVCDEASYENILQSPVDSSLRDIKRSISESGEVEILTMKKDKEIYFIHRFIPRKYSSCFERELIDNFSSKSEELLSDDVKVVEYNATKRPKYHPQEPDVISNISNGFCRDYEKKPILSSFLRHGLSLKINRKYQEKVQLSTEKVLFIPLRIKEDPKSLKCNRRGSVKKSKVVNKNDDAKVNSRQNFSESSFPKLSITILKPKDSARRNASELSKKEIEQKTLSGTKSMKFPDLEQGTENYELTERTLTGAVEVDKEIISEANFKLPEFPKYVGDLIHANESIKTKSQKNDEIELLDAAKNILEIESSDSTSEDQILINYRTVSSDAELPSYAEKIENNQLSNENEKKTYETGKYPLEEERSSIITEWSEKTLGGEFSEEKIQLSKYNEENVDRIYAEDTRKETFSNRETSITLNDKEPDVTTEKEYETSDLETAYVINQLKDNVQAVEAKKVSSREKKVQQVMEIKDKILRRTTDNSKTNDIPLVLEKYTSDAKQQTRSETEEKDTISDQETDDKKFIDNDTRKSTSVFDKKELEKWNDSISINEIITSENKTNAFDVEKQVREKEETERKAGQKYDITSTQIKDEKIKHTVPDKEKYASIVAKVGPLDAEGEKDIISKTQALAKHEKMKDTMHEEDEGLTIVRTKNEIVKKDDITSKGGSSKKTEQNKNDVQNEKKDLFRGGENMGKEEKIKHSNTKMNIADDKELIKDYVLVEKKDTLVTEKKESKEKTNESQEITTTHKFPDIKNLMENTLSDKERDGPRFKKEDAQREHRDKITKVREETEDSAKEQDKKFKVIETEEEQREQKEVQQILSSREILRTIKDTVFDEKNNDEYVDKTGRRKEKKDNLEVNIENKETLKNPKEVQKIVQGKQGIHDEKKDRISFKGEEIQREIKRKERINVDKTKENDDNRDYAYIGKSIPNQIKKKQEIMSNNKILDTKEELRDSISYKKKDTTASGTDTQNENKKQEDILNHESPDNREIMKTTLHDNAEVVTVIGGTGDKIKEEQSVTSSIIALNEEEDKETDDSVIKKGNIVKQSNIQKKITSKDIMDREKEYGDITSDKIEEESNVSKGVTLKRTKYPEMISTREAPDKKEFTKTIHQGRKTDDKYIIEGKIAKEFKKEQNLITRPKYVVRQYDIPVTKSKSKIGPIEKSKVSNLKISDGQSRALTALNKKYTPTKDTAFGRLKKTMGRIPETKIRGSGQPNMRDMKRNFISKDSVENEVTSISSSPNQVDEEKHHLKVGEKMHPSESKISNGEQANKNIGSGGIIRSKIPLHFSRNNSRKKKFFLHGPGYANQHKGLTEIKTSTTAEMETSDMVPKEDDIYKSKIDINKKESTYDEELSSRDKRDKDRELDQTGVETLKRISHISDKSTDPKSFDNQSTSTESQDISRGIQTISHPEKEEQTEIYLQNMQDASFQMDFFEDSMMCIYDRPEPDRIDQEMCHNDLDSYTDSIGKSRKLGNQISEKERRKSFNENCAKYKGDIETNSTITTDEVLQQADKIIAAKSLISPVIPNQELKHEIFPKILKTAMDSNYRIINQQDSADVKRVCESDCPECDCFNSRKLPDDSRITDESKLLPVNIPVEVIHDRIQKYQRKLRFNFVKKIESEGIQLRNNIISKPNTYISCENEMKHQESLPTITSKLLPHLIISKMIASEPLMKANENQRRKCSCKFRYEDVETETSSKCNCVTPPRKVHYTFTNKHELKQHQYICNPKESLFKQLINFRKCFQILPDVTKIEILNSVDEKYLKPVNIQVKQTQEEMRNEEWKKQNHKYITKEEEILINCRRNENGAYEKEMKIKNEKKEQLDTCNNIIKHTQDNATTSIIMNKESFSTKSKSISVKERRRWHFKKFEPLTLSHKNTIYFRIKGRGRIEKPYGDVCSMKKILHNKNKIKYAFKQLIEEHILEDETEMKKKFEENYRKTRKKCKKYTKTLSVSNSNEKCSMPDVFFYDMDKGVIRSVAAQNDNFRRKRLKRFSKNKISKPSSKIELKTNRKKMVKGKILPIRFRQNYKCCHNKMKSETQIVKKSENNTKVLQKYETVSKGDIFMQYSENERGTKKSCKCEVVKTKPLLKNTNECSTCANRKKKYVRELPHSGKICSCKLQMLKEIKLCQCGHRLTNRHYIELNPPCSITSKEYLECSDPTILSRKKCNGDDTIKSKKCKISFGSTSTLLCTKKLNETLAQEKPRGILKKIYKQNDIHFCTLPDNYGAFKRSSENPFFNNIKNTCSNVGKSYHIENKMENEVEKFAPCQNIPILSKSEILFINEMKEKFGNFKIMSENEEVANCEGWNHPKMLSCLKNTSSNKMEDFKDGNLTKRVHFQRPLSQKFSYQKVFNGFRSDIVSPSTRPVNKYSSIGKNCKLSDKCQSTITTRNISKAATKLNELLDQSFIILNKQTLNKQKKCQRKQVKNKNKNSRSQKVEKKVEHCGKLKSNSSQSTKPLKKLKSRIKTSRQISPRKYYQVSFLFEIIVFNTSTQIIEQDSTDEGVRREKSIRNESTIGNGYETVSFPCGYQDDLRDSVLFIRLEVLKKHKSFVAKLSGADASLCLLLENMVFQTRE